MAASNWSDGLTPDRGGRGCEQTVLIGWFEVGRPTLSQYEPIGAEAAADSAAQQETGSDERSEVSLSGNHVVTDGTTTN